MGATSIEWTDATWNPVTGCTKVSSGCKHCYAETIAQRFWGDRKFTDVRTHGDRLSSPLHWRKPRMVFVNSMSDLFHESVPDDFIADVFRVMGQCEQHTFQVLTKRPERMQRWMREQTNAHALRMIGDPEFCVRWPYPNVWLGVSVEDQKSADERIPNLLRTPAAVRFLSCEPLLGPVSLANYLKPPGAPDRIVRPGSVPIEYIEVRGIDWVIVGGESGPNARPMHSDWPRSIRDQCQAAGVPYFFKQWGEWIGAGQVVEGHGPDGRYHRWPDGAVSSRIGKGRAGRLLDGREWNEFPEVARVATA